jgi:hypothetical protein
VTDIPSRELMPRVYVARCFCCGKKLAGAGEWCQSCGRMEVYCTDCDVLVPSTTYVINHEDQTLESIAEIYA